MSGPISYVVTVAGWDFDVTIEPTDKGLVARTGDNALPVGWHARGPHVATVELGERRVEAVFSQDAESWWVALAGYQAEVTVVEARTLRLAATLPQAPARSGRVEVRAPMPGRLVAVRVEAGAALERGSVLAILEAMKMENELRAPCGGRVAEVRVAEGATVEHGAVLLVLEAAADAQPTEGRPSDRPAGGDV